MVRKQVPLDNNTYVLIDLSSFIFTRYFAIKSWAKISGTIISEGDSGRLFVRQKFEKTFIEKLLAIHKKFRVPWQNMYLAKDCPRDTIWRKDMYPEYKKNREERTLEFDPQIFSYTYETIIPELQKESKFEVISYKRAEADDIIAIIKEKIRIDKPDATIIIITNDNDFLQLLDSKTTILNSSLKPLKDKYTEEILSVFTKWKAIKGDVSDNIPPIESKIGDKTALKLATNQSLFDAKFINNAKALDQFRLNTTLIDFEYIPDSIRLGVRELVTLGV